MSQWLKVRLGLIFVVFGCFFSIVIFRLVQLQVIPNPSLSELSKRQFTKVDKKAPFRVPILDRNNEELALSVPVASLYAHPKKITSRKKTAQILSKILGGAPSKWLQKLDKTKAFVWLQRQVPEDKAAPFKKMKLPGIGIESENKRVYPNGTLAAHVLGYTDIDGNGLSGIELSQNSLLLEEQTKSRQAKDGRGQTSYIEKDVTSKSGSGPSLQLTLDRRLQAMVEQELEKSIQTTKAKSAMAIVMDPYNGEILALAQRPVYDPNSPNQTPGENQQNKLIQSLYEPGSTFKVFFAAEAIEKGLLKPQSVLDCGNGKIKIGKTLISEADKKHQHASLTLEKVIAYSSNVGAVRISQLLGPSGTLEVLRKYGLTAKTGIELPGETTGNAKSKETITPLLLATLGFGQGVSTTPLQLVTAFSPFANGGLLVNPTILKNSDEESQSQIGERIISEETAEAMRKILLSVTEDPKGTGFLAKIPNVLVAGKTGTAQKYEPELGYKSGKYYSSFVGFLPADKPQFLIGVMVDEPRSHYYASLVATPLFKSIAEHSLHFLNRGPNQLTKQDTTLPRKDIVAPKTLTKSEEGNWIMPNLTGLTLQEAMNLLNQYVEKVEVSGNGYVSSQVPASGTQILPQSSVRLELKGFSD